MNVYLDSVKSPAGKVQTSTDLAILSDRQKMTSNIKDKPGFQ